MRSDLESLAAPCLDGDLDGTGQERLEVLLQEDAGEREEFLELMEQARALDVMVPAMVAETEGSNSMLATEEDRFTRSVMDGLPARPPMRRGRVWPWGVAAAGLLAFGVWFGTRPAPPPPPVADPLPVAVPDAPKPETPEPAQAVRSSEPSSVAPVAVAPARPFKLGVVNLKRCFDRSEYKRIEEVDADLQSMAQDLTQKVKALEQKMAVIRQKIGAISRAEHSRLWESKRRELAVVETQLKFEKELGRARYVSYYNDRKIEVYNDIRKAVSEVALEEAFDLVLRVEAPFLRESEEGPRPGVMDQINNRVVLFHDTGVDITDRVLEHLNRKWDARKKDN